MAPWYGLWNILLTGHVSASEDESKGGPVAAYLTRPGYASTVRNLRARSCLISPSGWTSATHGPRATWP